jgi:hypothetical protein
MQALANAITLQSWYWPVGQALEFSIISYGTARRRARGCSQQSLFAPFPTH